MRPAQESKGGGVATCKVAPGEECNLHDEQSRRGGTVVRKALPGSSLRVGFGDWHARC